MNIIPKQPLYWELSIDLVVVNYTQGNTSILHFTAENENSSPGDQIPSIVMENNVLRINF